MADTGTLDGRVALVTGAGRGIGRAVARKLAAEGAAVVVNDLDDGPAAAVAEEIAGDGGQAVACAGNVVDPDFPDRFTNTAVDTFGGIDIVVNNAGYSWDAVVQKMSDEQWQTMLDVHLTAPFRILRAVQPIFSAAAAHGQRPHCRKVVNISSLVGLGGNPGQVNYASAKAGVIGMTKTLAKEWGRYNVTVNCVAFGLIETRLTKVTAQAGETVTLGDHEVNIGVNADLLESMRATIPLRRAGSPEDAAGAVYLFCIPESDYVSGQVLICGGGLTL